MSHFDIDMIAHIAPSAHGVILTGNRTSCLGNEQYCIQITFISSRSKG